MMLRTNARAFLGASSRLGRNTLMARFSTASRDYYTVLGISKQAQIEEIREAYKRLAKEYHPSLFAEAAQAVR